MVTYKKNVKGIYLIEYLNGKEGERTFYVGLARDIFSRWKDHCNSNQQFIDKSLQKYGYENFCFKILEQVSKESELKANETKWINIYKKKYGEERMFNISETTNTNPYQIDYDIKDRIKQVFEHEIGRSIYAIAEKYEVGFKDVIEIRKPFLKKRNLKYDSDLKMIVNKKTGEKPENWKGNKITKMLSEKIISLKNQNKDNKDIAVECNLSITDLKIFYKEYEADKNNYDFAETIN